MEVGGAVSWNVGGIGVQWCYGNACFWEGCCASAGRILEGTMMVGGVTLTLGSGLGGEECCDNNGVATLGAAVACEGSGSGICSILFN